MINSIDPGLERYMDLLSARQKVVASNIANADTPGYKTQDLDFQGELAMATGTPRLTAVGGLPVKNDGNDVNLDREARMLAENALRFNLASNLMHGELQMIKEAIHEGKSA